MIRFVPTWLALAVLIVCGFHAIAQERSIILQSGPVPLESFKPIQEISARNLSNNVFGNRLFTILHFDRIPTQEQQEALQNLGIKQVGYLPHNAFLVSIPTTLPLSTLRAHGVAHLIEMEPQFKMHSSLAEGRFPEHTIAGERLKLIVSTYQSVSVEALRTALMAADLSIRMLKRNDLSMQNQPSLAIEVPREHFWALAGLPVVQFIQPISGKRVPNGIRGRNNDRANFLNSVPGSGLDGSGVSIACSDRYHRFNHIDFTNRVHLNDSGAMIGNNTEYHGLMTMGVAVAAGNLNPKIQGIAPGANIEMWFGIDNDLHLKNAKTNLLNLGTVIASTSYGDQVYGGDYDGSSILIDKQVKEENRLLHVFSNGNYALMNTGMGTYSHVLTSTPGMYFGTVNRGTGVAKNAIAVANITANLDERHGSSSIGPASDGRLKPDVASSGHGQMSTDENNGEQPAEASSSAAPGVAGLAAILYQSYRQIHSTDPNSALIKNAILNSADDKGRPGPDYEYGYGRVNGRKAGEIFTLPNRHFSSSFSETGSSWSQPITIPNNVAEVKVMLTWIDPEASPNAGQALINDLDLSVTTPMMTTVEPWILGTAQNTASLEANATRGPDRLNNVEQVTITNPTSGTYIIQVNAFALPAGGQQEFFITYLLEYDEVKMVYPKGGESVEPGESVNVCWDAFGNSAPFDVELSLDGGISWMTMASNIDPTKRTTAILMPPLTISGEAQVRVRRGNQTSTSGDFSLFGTLDETTFLIQPTRGDRAKLSWIAVPSVVPIVYDVYQLGNEYMELIGSTSEGEFEITGLQPGQEYWFAVAANKPLLNMHGRRSIAVPYVHQDNACTDCDQATHTTFPYSEGFENGFGMWCQGINDNFDWTIESGPYAPVEGSNYLYSDLGGNLTYSESTIESNCFAFPAVSNIDMTFNYRLEGFGNGTLALQASTNNGFTWETVSSTPLNNSNTWISEQVDLTAYSGQNTILRFHVVSTVATNYNRVAIDGINISTSPIPCNDCSGAAWTAYPYHDDFETDLGMWCNRDNTLDDFDWTRHIGNTPTANTGPWMELQNEFFLYTEADGNTNSEAVLDSRCFDLPANSDISMTFSFGLHGADIDHLRLDVATGNSIYYQSVWALFGNHGPQAQQAYVDLSGYAGNKVRFSFVGVTGNGVLSDIGIDDISIDVTPNKKEEDQAETLEESAFKLFPVPASETMILHASEEHDQATFRIVDMLGRNAGAVRSSQTLPGQYAFDVSTLDNGSYILVMISNNQTKSLPFTVAH